MAQELTQERLKELLHYDPETGIFTWKASVCNVPRGAVAGNVRPDKYVAIGVDGQKYLAHQLALFYAYGVWAPYDVDHADRDKMNNRLKNLRPATRSQNKFNQEILITNTSGYNGVGWKKREGMWVAYITINGKQKHLGLFQNIADAVQARKSAEVMLGVSEFVPDLQGEKDEEPILY